jgi:hypothetical protein
MASQNQDLNEDTIEYMRGGGGRGGYGGGRGGGHGRGGGRWGGHGGGGRWSGHGGRWGNNYYGDWGNYGGTFYPWYSYNAYYPYGLYSYSYPVTTEVVQQNVVTQNLGSCVCTLDEKDPKKLNIVNQCINGGIPVPVNISDQCQCQCQPQQ